MMWFHKHKRTIFLIAAGVFILGSFAGFGSYFIHESPLDAVAIVNEDTIPYKRFVSYYQAAVNELQQKRSLSEMDRQMLKRQILQGMIQEKFFMLEAKKYGLSVSDNELAGYIQSIPAFQSNGVFDQQKYMQILGSNLHMSVDDFERDRRSEILVQKVQFLMANAVKVSPLEFQTAYQQAMTQAPKEEREKITANPPAFREQWRQNEVNLSLQEWYGVARSQLKIQVLLDRFEPKPVVPPTGAGSVPGAPSPAPSSPVQP